MGIQKLPPQLNEAVAFGLNNLIKTSGVDTNLISDGYHTFSELHEHRIELFITLCRMFAGNCKLWKDGYDVCSGIWKSKKHADGTAVEGFFIMGIRTVPGLQISYHLPLSKWGETDFARELDTAPEWDGHSSADVLQRLKML